MKVICECGNVLKISSVHHDRGDDLRVVVEVCLDCMNEVRKAATDISE